MAAGFSSASVTPSEVNFLLYSFSKLFFLSSTHSLSCSLPVFLSGC